MKKILVFGSIVGLAVSLTLFLNSENYMFNSQNIKYVTRENNVLGVYEYIHELTHSFVSVNKKM